MRDTTDRVGAMALKLDVSRTEDIAVVRCRGRIVFDPELRDVPPEFAELEVIEFENGIQNCSRCQ
jgi:hypothetical protein